MTLTKYKQYLWHNTEYSSSNKRFNQKQLTQYITKHIKINALQ